MRGNIEPPSPFYISSTRSGRNDEDCRSVGSYKNSEFSQSIVLSFYSTTQRINQIKPKNKLTIGKSTALSDISKQLNLENHKLPKSQKPNFQLPLRNKKSLGKKETGGQNQNELINESMDYGSIKPPFGWNKLTILCGGLNQGGGQNGCDCGPPCPWRLQWTKNVHRKDLVAFRKLLEHGGRKEDIEQIDKDVGRTYSQNVTFSRNKRFRCMLREVLMAYSIYDMEMGYVQGVNMIVGVLLYHIKSAEETFWALVDLMEQQQLRLVYLGKNLQYLKFHCQGVSRIIERRVSDLHKHMIELEIGMECFLHGWLLSLMATSVPLQCMQGVIERFRKQGWPYVYRLIVTYLLFMKENLLSRQDQAEFLVILNVQTARDLGVEWKELIEAADRLIL